MKRETPAHPLTPDDVAERLSKAMLRTWRILMDIRQDPVLYQQVRHSRYLTVFPFQLADELEHWKMPARSAFPGPGDHANCHTATNLTCLRGQDDCPMKGLEL